MAQREKGTELIVRSQDAERKKAKRGVLLPFLNAPFVIGGNLLSKAEAAACSTAPKVC